MPLIPNTTVSATSLLVGQTGVVPQISLVSLVVADYDPAISFFVDALGFELIKDEPAVSSVDGSAKRWVEVRPPGAASGLLLARAANDKQTAAIGNQTGGRVGFFYQVDNFDETYQRMQAAGVEFCEEPRREDYGQVVVFLDIAGNKWDLLGP